jgi:septal ring factor EnvC (AmiA/AmiB activator)
MLRIAASAGVMVVIGIALLAPSNNAVAAPALQLPWPTGTQHRIDDGNTYGCDTHDDADDWFAIDFEFAINQPVSAAAAGSVINADDDADGFGKKIVIDHGGGYTTTYAHLNAFAVVGGTVTQGATVG